MNAHQIFCWYSNGTWGMWVSVSRGPGADNSLAVGFYFGEFYFGIPHPNLGHPATLLQASVLRQINSLID